MKVKELYRKYKDYRIMLFGRPLSEKTIPFTCLPKNKNVYECEVVEIKINDIEFVSHTFNLKLKHKSNDKYKGTIYVYIK